MASERWRRRRSWWRARTTRSPKGCDGGRWRRRRRLWLGGGGELEATDSILAVTTVGMAVDMGDFYEGGFDKKGKSGCYVALRDGLFVEWN